MNLDDYTLTSMCGQPTATTNVTRDRTYSMLQTSGIHIRTDKPSLSSNSGNGNDWYLNVYTPVITDVVSIVSQCLNSDSGICANFEFNSDIAETASQCTGKDKFWDESLGVCYNKLSLPGKDYTLYIANPSKYRVSNVSNVSSEITAIHASVTGCFSAGQFGIACLKALPLEIE